MNWLNDQFSFVFVEPLQEDGIKNIIVNAGAKKGFEPHTDSKQIAIKQRKTKSDLQRVAFVGEIFFLFMEGGIGIFHHPLSKWFIFPFRYYDYINRLNQILTSVSGFKSLLHLFHLGIFPHQLTGKFLPLLLHFPQFPFLKKEI